MPSLSLSTLLMCMMPCLSLRLISSFLWRTGVYTLNAKPEKEGQKERDRQTESEKRDLFGALDGGDF